MYRANRVSLKKPEAVKWAEINVKEFDSICQNLREACPDLEPPKPLRSKANPNTPGKTPTTESASTDTRPTTAHGIDSTVNEDNIPATGKSGKKTVRNTRAKTHTPTPTRAQSNGECAGESTAVRESNESERLTDSEKDGDTNTHTQGNTAGDTHTRTPGHAHGSMHKVLDEGVGSDKESAVIRSRSVVTTKRADGLMAAAKLQATPSTSANQIAENRKRRPMKTTDSSRKFTPGKPSNLAGGARKKLKTNEMEPIEEREGETELQTQSGVAKGLRFFQTDRNNESFAEFSARIIAAARLKQKLAVNKNDVSGVGVSVSAEDVPALGTAGMAA
ncbi:hypothetical protein SARC_03035 [Sphaeroforma arctica JP610]|uniref:Uncharacterized protein n=1 Tax=Sphaeroforma arctica JP610 TaxID=667725 RepID=A0A0L0G770_9EUKA|nr:hypothetical protein SARC_03035 [Sphaeroforma arctica JP610]KNC84764.1 hypothetical protein SARC_03035 [Sphaeroforma arctica JP610]|eukprot:XP_014158666.1 hypothetical protein SARC_03035 [Sphaeroforma arctica JP610]